MKFSTTLIALVAAGLANAQLPDVPSCSLSCFVSALTTDGCSSLTDFACHCQKPALVSTITPCVQKACAVADQISVSNAVVAQCSSAGHPISVPPIETTSAGSTTSASSSASATDSSSSASATDSSSSSASASASATATGGSSSSSSAAGSSAAGSTAAGSSTPLPSKTSGGASSATTSAVWTGAAVNVKGNMAGVAAVAAAAAYIL
ncbi:Putative GPI anchored CFEM domain protein [Penicillium brasilianum]|uniref:Putative GPI anchored CFEM domain protein n=1 Tax=Penicillium brasilianum TaxID=104259 RepID=A0A0F7TMT0_PENBI|nr:Putative GPI anchored CFEM domain protein [Penicillium brasilianum]